MILMTSLFSVVNFEDVDAADKLVAANSIGFEKTTIIEFENSGNYRRRNLQIMVG